MCCVVVELTKYSTRDDCWRFGRRRSTSTKTDASGEALAPLDSGNTLLMIQNYRLGQRYVFLVLVAASFVFASCFVYRIKWAYLCTTYASARNNYYLVWPASTMTHVLLCLCQFESCDSGQGCTIWNKRIRNMRARKHYWWYSTLCGKYDI